MRFLNFRSEHEWAQCELRENSFEPVLDFGVELEPLYFGFPVMSHLNESGYVSQTFPQGLDARENEIMERLAVTGGLFQKPKNLKNKPALTKNAPC